MIETLTPAPVVPIVWTDEELIAQWRRCVEWNDPDQWDALGFLYQSRGYNLNRNACWRRADECRATTAESIPARME